MPLIYDLSSYLPVLVAVAVVATWIISIRIYPVIIYIVQKKNLMDEPDERSSHIKKVPTLGGVGMFLAFSLALMLFGIFVALEEGELVRLISIVAATIILLFLGIKDDLLVLAPKKKFLGQIFAAAIVILATDVRISSFGGIMGIAELPYIASVLFTVCVFIVIINAFNLTDGIDGLAGSIATLCSAIFGFFFLVNGEMFLSLVSFTLVGALIGFLSHNFSERQKLFMGDSGSLFLGYMLAYQGVCFVEVSASETALYTVPHAPIILLALLSYPMVDSLRVFAVRIYNGKHPFHADRNHIHHRFVDVGYSHMKATFAISISNVLMVGLIWLINDWDPTVQFFTGLFAGMVLYMYPFVILTNEELRLKLANDQPNILPDKPSLRNPLEVLNNKRLKVLKEQENTSSTRKPSSEKSQIRVASRAASLEKMGNRKTS